MWRRARPTTNNTSITVVQHRCALQDECEWTPMPEIKIVGKLHKGTIVPHGGFCQDQGESFSSHLALHATVAPTKLCRC